MNLRRVIPLAAAKLKLEQRLARQKSPGLRFLCYHAVIPNEQLLAVRSTPTITVDALRDHIRVLRHRGLRIITMREALDILHSGSADATSAVCITFDDGFANNAELAWPILHELGCPAHFFVSAEHAAAATAPRADGCRFATVEQLRTMIREGATIGCHGASHVDLRRVSAEQLAAETLGAKRLLESALGTAIDTFAYPYGAFDARVIGAVERARFSAAFIVRLGAIRGTNYQRWTVPRTIIDDDESMTSFDIKICGGFDWVAHYSAAKQWIDARQSVARVRDVG